MKKKQVFSAGALSFPMVDLDASYNSALNEIKKEQVKQLEEYKKKQKKFITNLKKAVKVMVKDNAKKLKREISR